MIEIMNLREDEMFQPWDVRIDRTSVLGNPYYMRTEADRDGVCDRYAAWMSYNIQHGDKKVIDEMSRIITLYRKYGKLRLFCWCAPKRCHGEELRREIKSIVSLRGDL